jgi:hypothetical protein
MVHKNKRSSKKKVLLAFLLILVAAMVVVGLEVTNTTHIFHKSAIVRAPAKPITTLASPSTSTTNTVKAPSASNAIDQGGPSDENGQVPAGTPTTPDSWSKSASGVITVKLPTLNQTFQNGGTITGVASVSQVQYRLSDDQVGVISQGPINVVNGSFTATISFKPYGTSGRLDVFTTDSTGKEANEVQIPVTF